MFGPNPYWSIQGDDWGGSDVEVLGSRDTVCIKTNVGRNFYTLVVIDISY